jgi:hypothetical protein
LFPASPPTMPPHCSQSSETPPLTCQPHYISEQKLAYYQTRYKSALVGQRTKFQDPHSWANKKNPTNRFHSIVHCVVHTAPQPGAVGLPTLLLQNIRMMVLSKPCSSKLCLLLGCPDSCRTWTPNADPPTRTCCRTLPESALP